MLREPGLVRFDTSTDKDFLIFRSDRSSMKTYNFDYTYALTIDTVNEILQLNLALIDLEVSYSRQNTGSSLTLTGKLAPWSIVTGGSNQLLRFNVLFSSGTLTVEEPTFGTRSYDLAGAIVQIEANLGWLGAGSSTNSQGNSDSTGLVFDFHSRTLPGTRGNVSAYQVIDPSGKLQQAGQILRDIMPDLLVQNKDKLQSIFARINPAPGNVGSWLAPKCWDYYYAESGGKGYLCFLCMVSDNPLPSALGFDTSIFSLFPNANTFFSISREMFLRNVVLPALQQTFSGSSFSVANLCGNWQLLNQNNVTIDKLTATSLICRIDSDGLGLRVTVSGGGPLKFLFGLADLPGAYFSWQVGSLYLLQFDATKQTVTFLPDPNPCKHADHYVPAADWVLLFVIDILNIAGIASLIYDATAGFINQINNLNVDGVNTCLGQAFGGNPINLANLVDWNRTGWQLTLQTAGLDGDFYMVADLQLS